MEITKSKAIHLIGIGGVGMSAIAKLLLEMGMKVTGSDMKENLATIRLKDMGAKVYFKQDPKNLREADVVVVSGAIPLTNVEYAYAVSENYPILPRAKMLDWISGQFTKSIAVAGTHGKTSTSGIITRMLEALNKNPSYVIGGELVDYGSNSALNRDEYIVLESDESDGSFLMVHPQIAVVTNIEEDHMNFYKTRENLISHFKRFMAGVLARRGSLIVNGDDPIIKAITAELPQIGIKYFSIKTPSDVMAKNITSSPDGISYDLFLNEQDIGRVKLNIHGVHNVYNSLAAFALGSKENASMELCKKGVMAFCGVKRRLQLIGTRLDRFVYDDYAHHSTEIKTTLEGLKQSFGRRIICIFQPHRYSRTELQMDELAEALMAADVIMIAAIYTCNEAPIPGVSSKIIVDKIKKLGHTNVYDEPKKSKIPPHAVSLSKPGDVIITMGAGDVYTLGTEIVKRLAIMADDEAGESTDASHG